MPETMSVERRNLVKAYGATVKLDKWKGWYEGCYQGCGGVERSSIPGSIILSSSENQANPERHYLTTGPEIWRVQMVRLMCL